MNIGAVERDTGLSKDTLRMWERRYAFPTPERDRFGERVYSASQVRKLLLIKRLMDLGHRPGKIIGQSLEALESIGSAGVEPASQSNPEIERFINLIASHESDELRHQLALSLATSGLKTFVLQTVAPLNHAVGEAWMRGRLAVFEEHMYSELVRGVMRTAISSVQPQGRAPRVLLTSLPGEQHSLGLLMAEALLVVEGAFCVPLGVETPVEDVSAAAQGHAADIVALSFSGSYGEQKAAARLKDLRTLLPGSTEIWAGGSAIARIRRPLPGVRLVASLADITGEVARWREAAGCTQPHA